MDPYVYLGTTVLKNHFDIRDADRLSKLESILTTRRTVELEDQPPMGVFDARHLQAIHRYIFQDLFEWAGKFRTVDIYKSDPFAFHQFIASSLDNVTAQLKAEHHLRGLNLNSFANRAAYYLGEINAIHPFREGNGRTQREFIRQLAAHNSFAINWTHISREENMDASRHSIRVDNTALEKLLLKALRERE